MSYVVSLMVGAIVGFLAAAILAGGDGDERYWLNDPAVWQGRSTCYGCGRSGMVRVLADSGYPIKTEMSTVRVPPDGWEWRFADGMPRWVCDECLGVSDE